MNQRLLPEVYLICTGLGRIQRGFESHISALGETLLAEKNVPFSVTILGAAKHGEKDPVHRIPSISRNHWLLKAFRLSWRKSYLVEQASFLVGMLPILLMRKPAVIYLAEYHLYCWLYKMRKLFKLPFSLVLYTGAHAVPGLFDKQRDFVHHISEALVQTATDMGIPVARQKVIPHFIADRFDYDDDLINKIRQKAGGKKVVLSVGAMNTNHKRMDLLVKTLAPFSSEIFPVLIGDITDESPLIESLLQQHFDEDYLLTSCKASETGSYYAAADLFVSASAYETFGLTYLEACWHGLPLLCHGHETLKTIVANHTEMVDFVNAAQVGTAIQNILQQLPDPALASKLKHDFVIERYGWQSVRVAYISMFSALCPST